VNDAHPHAARTFTIAVVCYPSLGGSGIVATELAVGLARRGHRLHIITSRDPARPLPQCESLTLHRTIAADYPLFERAPDMLAQAGAIATIAQQYRVDIIHVHYAVPHAASAYLARQLLGASAPRLVTSLHGTDVTRVGSDPSYQAITRFCVEASDAITAPSEFLQVQAKALLGVTASREIDVIPNCVDTQQFAPPTAARDPRYFDRMFAGKPGPVLFHVSNFRPVKRVTDLLETLARVRKTVRARLVLVGDGPDRAAAGERARELGLEASVCFLGPLPDFSAHLRQADAFLMTSETESFGLAALEALSCGVPVLGYRVGGLPTVVTEHVGRLVDPFDRDALAAAVVSVVSNADTRRALGEAARRRVLEHFRLQPALERYERLFERVTAQGIAT
jgi:N-acetyl-alpha-D-glucosaminyl L-malate synthase BshA